jgi:putative nucleotidyltransferase-like protein
MRPPPSLAPHVDLTTVFANLAVDRATVEIVRALRTDSIDPILLKGPVVERSLYDGRGERGYCDCDLLVAPGDFSIAERALERLGFRRFLGTEDFPFKEPLHAVTWRRPGDRAVVDLHRTLMGVGATATTTWEVLLGNTERLRLGDLDVTVPDEPAGALIIALHAAQHGLRLHKPHLDLDRALERFTPSVWRCARRLAERLEAGDAMAAGLRLRPAGITVADRLGLPQTYSAEVTL